jgi:hypothetical protein
MEQCSKSCKLFFGVIVAAVMISSVIWLLADTAKKTAESANTITVSDTGTVYTKPDLALATVSVVSEAKTVAGATSDNTEKMNAVIEAIKGQGVEEKDLKTINFSIYPRYEYDKTVDPYSSYYPSGRRVLVGYEVNQSLQVKIRDLTKVGAIIQVATDEGANEVGSLQFTVDEQDAIKAQAREEAISKAKAKAKELAKQLGIRLVRISSFNESGSTPYYYSLDAKSAAPVAMGGGVEEASILTGENKIEVTVSITYEIN